MALYMVNPPMNFETFQKRYDISLETFCRDMFRQKMDVIRIKKEETAVKNLVVIVEAALALAVEKGFDAMSLRDLQARSGLSMGCLYSYFSGKEVLLNLMQEQGRRRVAEVLTDALKNPLPPSQRLEMAIRTHLYLSEGMHRWFYFSYMETKNLGREETRKAIESELLTESVFVEILQQGEKTGDFLVRDARLTAAMIKAMLQDWYLKRWKYKKRSIHVDAYADFLISFVHAALANVPLQERPEGPGHEELPAGETS